MRLSLPNILSPLARPSKACKACTRRLSTHAGRREPFKILFLGSDDFSIASLDALLGARDLWTSIDVVTSPEKAVGRGKKAVVLKPPLQAFAQQHHLATHTLPHSGIKAWTLPEPFNSGPSPSHVLITASFGAILPAPLLSLFPSPQKLNVHPSLLPRYRGAAPIQWTIANGDESTGVSVQEIGIGVDTGAILGSVTGLNVEPNDTYHSLLPRLATAGAETLLSVLRTLHSSPEFSGTPQDDAHATKAPKIKRETAFVDFSARTAEEIERRHRAFSHQHPLWSEIYGMDVTLLDVFVVRRPDAASAPGTLSLIRSKPAPHLEITCAAGTTLGVRRLQTSGRKAVSASDWYNGLRHA